MKEKQPLYNRLWFLIPTAIILILLAFIGSIIPMKLSSNTTLDTNIIANAIYLVGLITSAITIIFVYRTYHLQKIQIEESKKDVEYNRVLDMVYKQLEYTKKSFEEYKTIGLPITNQSNKQRSNKSFYEQFKEIAKQTIIPPINSTNQINIIKLSIITKALYNLIPILEVYDHIINESSLENKQKNFLIKLVVDNLDKELIERVEQIQKAYHSLQTEYKEDYINLKEGHFTKTHINKFEWDLSIILKYLRIDVYTDLFDEDNKN